MIGGPGSLEPPAEGSIELPGTDGHLRRRAALDLDLHAGGGPVEAPAAERSRGAARGQAAGEEQRQLAEVVLLHGAQVREETRRRLEGQRVRVVRLPDAEGGGIQGAGGSGEAGHELTAGDHGGAAVGATVSVGAGCSRRRRREQRGGVREQLARSGRRGRGASAADGGGGGVGEAGLAAGAAADAEAVLAGRRGLAGLLEHPRDHPLVLIQQSKAATSKQCIRNFAAAVV